MRLILRIRTVGKLGTSPGGAAEEARMQCRLALLAILAIASRSAAQSGFDQRGVLETEGRLLNPLNITLVWYDVDGLRPRDVEGMAREVESVFREIGVDVELRSGPVGEAPRNPEGIEIPVVLLAAPSGGASPRVMGAVLRRHPPPSPVWIFLDNVRSALGHAPGRSGPLSERAEQELDVALGRIIAHEVIHAAAPWRPHTRGLMGRAIDRAGLTGLRRPLSPDCAAAVRGGLAALARAKESLPQEGRLIAAH